LSAFDESPSGDLGSHLLGSKSSRARKRGKSFQRMESLYQKLAPVVAASDGHFSRRESRSDGSRVRPENSQRRLERGLDQKSRPHSSAGQRKNQETGTKTRRGVRKVRKRRVGERMTERRHGGMDLSETTR